MSNSNKMSDYIGNDMQNMQHNNIANTNDTAEYYRTNILNKLVGGSKY